MSPEEIDNFVASAAKAKGIELLDLLAHGLLATGTGHCPIIGTRSGRNPEIGCLLFAVSCKLSDDDMRRFIDMAKAFMHDVTAGEGIDTQTITVVNKLAE